MTEPGRLNAGQRGGDRGTMRASLPLLLPLLSAPLALAIACGPEMTSAPLASAPQTASTPAPTATTAAPATDAPETSATTSAPAASAVECTKDEPCDSSADAGPPPLRAGKGGAGPFVEKHDAAAKSAAPCTKDTLKQQLQSIVDACRKSSRSICGDLVLHTTPGDAGDDNVSVDFNLGTSGNTTGFSKCVVAKINSVTWQCAAPGGDIHLDLGCRL